MDSQDLANKQHGHSVRLAQSHGAPTRGWARARKSLAERLRVSGIGVTAAHAPPWPRNGSEIIRNGSQKSLIHKMLPTPLFDFGSFGASIDFGPWSSPGVWTRAPAPTITC